MDVAHDTIRGGAVGVGVIADFTDSIATLHGERIFGTTDAKTKTIQCCGFTATVVIRQTQSTEPSSTATEHSTLIVGAALDTATSKDSITRRAAERPDRDEVAEVRREAAPNRRAIDGYRIRLTTSGDLPALTGLPQAVA
jgi:hypothetical protein